MHRLTHRATHCALQAKREGVEAAMRQRESQQQQALRQQQATHVAQVGWLLRISRPLITPHTVTTLPCIAQPPLDT